MELKDILDDFETKEKTNDKKRQKYHRLIEKRKNQLQWAKDRLENNRFPSWIDTIIVPIAEEMLKQMPDRHYRILGPFGLAAETSIHFYNKEETDTLDITFVPDLENCTVSLKDYSKNCQLYAKGTVGELNGFNYAIIPLKDTIEELMEWLYMQNRKDEVNE